MNKNNRGKIELGQRLFPNFFDNSPHNAVNLRQNKKETRETQNNELRTLQVREYSFEYDYYVLRQNKLAETNDRTLVMSQTTLIVDKKDPQKLILNSILNSPAFLCYPLGVRVTTLTTLNTDYIISQKVVFHMTTLISTYFTHYFKNTISHFDLGSSQC